MEPEVPGSALEQKIGERAKRLGAWGGGVRGTGSGACIWEGAGGLWFTVLGSWTCRGGGPYREVLWL